MRLKEKPSPDVDYKILTHDIGRPLSEAEVSLLEDINNAFDKEDILFSTQNNQVEVYLRKVDLDLLKAIARKAAHNRKIPWKGSAPQLLIGMIRDIGSYGIKGKKRVFIGFNKERKVSKRLEKVQKRGMHYYARESGFSQVNREMPGKYINQLICGDSLKVLKGLPDNCVDIVFTSPPYNFGLEYSSNHDAHGWEKYFEQLFAVFDECIRVLKWGGRFVVNVQPLFSDYIPSHHFISRYFTNRRMIWKGEILWEKNNYNCKYTAWGSWKSPSNPYLKYTWEFVEVFAKGSMKKEGDRSRADITPDEFKKWVVAKWSIAPERRMKTFGHPAMFPEELAARVLKLFSFKNDVVLDPFNGVGTTSYVAKTLERRFLGIDISKKYTETAKRRIQKILL